MRYLFFDLETTGLPTMQSYSKYYPWSQLDKYNGSRIVQIAVLVYNNRVQVSSYNYIIKPNGFRITNQAIHGITHADADTLGTEFNTAVRLLQLEFNKADFIIAHNAAFDKNVLLSELYRAGYYSLVKTIDQKPTICTMLSTGRWLKLGELHYQLFGKHPPGLHNAVVDTQILAKCYFEIEKRRADELALGQ